jgi:hypothetical protein
MWIYVCFWRSVSNPFDCSEPSVAFRTEKEASEWVASRIDDNKFEYPFYTTIWVD